MPLTPMQSPLPLLEPDEPPAVLEENRQGRCAYVITVDHASARIPRRLQALGLPAAEQIRHIAWDIGALAVARHVAARLDAPLIAQNYSRLVIDCNRDPAVASSIPLLSEHTRISGNEHLTPQQVQARREEIFEPYHQHIRALLDERRAAGRPTLLVAQHSMTDCYLGQQRPMHAAVLYNRDSRLALALLAELRRETSLQVADNEPYFVSDATDYTIPRHGEARGLLHVEIEIRQDLIAQPSGQAEWGERIAQALLRAQQRLAPTADGA
jgi:predicted N-formylglutamate amidohydrolase